MKPKFFRGPNIALIFILVAAIVFGLGFWSTVSISDQVANDPEIAEAPLARGMLGLLIAEAFLLPAALVAIGFLVAASIFTVVNLTKYKQLSLADRLKVLAAVLVLTAVPAYVFSG